MGLRIQVRVLFLAIWFAAGFAQQGNAQKAGDLDPTFGVGGKVVTSFSTPGTNTQPHAQAAALQPDGKIVVAGFLGVQEGYAPPAPPSGPYHEDFLVVRYNPDGSLDPGFGSGGKVTTDFGGRYDEAYAVAIQSDGRIVVAGTSFTSSYDFAVARYNTDGSLDASFGSGGKVLNDLYGYSGSQQTAYAVGILDVNNAVIAGDSINDYYGSSSFTYVDYDLYYGGSINGHFGNAGVVQRYIVPDLHNYYWYNAVRAITVRPGTGGSFISAGITTPFENNPPAYFAIASYDHYGLPDERFGDHGSPVVTDFGTKAGARAVAIQADGKIVVAGGWTNPNTEALARYNPDGSLDASFGSGGKIITNSGEASGVAIQPDGKIVVGAGGGIGDFVVSRRNPDGSLDPSFGTGGRVVTDFGGYDAIVAIALQPDGKIIAVGYGSGITLARYIAGPPPTPHDFNGDGTSDLLFRNTQAGDVSAWLMNGLTIQQGQVVYPGLSSLWQIAGKGDLNGDGKADLVFRNTQTGDVSAWLMNGAAINQTAVIYPALPSLWQIAGVGDLDGDGKADLVFRNTTTGDVSGWLMNGLTINQAAVIYSALPSAWQISGIGDLDADGKTDLVFRNTTTGDVSGWLMNGLTIKQAGVVYPGLASQWQISRVGDLDANGKADLVFRNTTTGEVSAWLMNGLAVSQAAVVGSPPLAWAVADIGDLDADGKTDLVFRNTTTGDVLGWLMNGLTIKQASVFYSALPSAWQFQ